MENVKLKKVKAVLLLLLLTVFCSVMPGTLSRAASDTVAKIGDVSYSSLEAAVKKVKNGQTIVLQKNVTYSKSLSLTRNKTYTINLNKHTITFSKKSAYLAIKNGSVTISNGTIMQTTKTGYAIRVRENGTLTIKSGTYKGMVANDGTLTIQKGTFTSTNSSSVSGSALLTNTGTVTIKAGTFDGKVNTLINNYGTMKIKGGTFTGNGTPNGTLAGEDESPSGYLIYNDTAAGKLTISNGTFTTDKTVIMCGGTSSKASVTISGGTFTTTDALNDYAPTMIIANKGSITIKAGTFTAPNALIGTATKTAKVKISGGTFTKNIEGWAILIASSGKITVTGGTFNGERTAVYYGNVTVSSNVAYNTRSLELIV